MLKKGINILLVLLFIPLSSLVAEEQMAVCIWDLNGCTVIVTQYYDENGDSSWFMDIHCTDGETGGGSGYGSWGGYCKGDWQTTPKRTNLPDSNK